MIRNPYLAAAGMGMVAGMRSMSAPALVSDHFARHPLRPPGRLPAPLAGPAPDGNHLQIPGRRRSRGRQTAVLPARIDPGPLAGRAVSGALAGGAVCVAEGESLAAGAAIGALAAVASAFVFYHLRKSLGEKTHIPDPVLALAEDALVLSVGRIVLG